MTRHIIVLMVVAVTVSLFAACTITPDTYTLAVAGDRRITLADIQQHPYFRELIDEFVNKMLIADECAAKGIKIPEEKINERLEEMITGSGGRESWETSLAMQNMSEENVRDRIMFQMMFEELLKSKVEVKEEEVRAEFEVNPDYYRRDYARQHDLTVDEQENLTFDEMKEYLIDQFKLTRGYQLAQPTLDELREKAKIDYVYMTPEQRADFEKREALVKKVRQQQEAETSALQVQENGSGEKSAEGAESAPAESAEGGGTDADEKADQEKAPDESAESGQAEEASGEDTAGEASTG